VEWAEGGRKASIKSPKSLCSTVDCRAVELGVDSIVVGRVMEWTMGVCVDVVGRMWSTLPFT
jgi:hypothetical protein